MIAPAQADKTTTQRGTTSGFKIGSGIAITGTSNDLIGFSLGSPMKGCLVTLATVFVERSIGVLRVSYEK